jgi:hypothetical protein
MEIGLKLMLLLLTTGVEAVVNSEVNSPNAASKRK